VARFVVGIDFGGPSKGSAQRRKILAIAARRVRPREYVVDSGGLNARLLENPPGWTALELADALIDLGGSVAAVAADFPFSLPEPLLRSESFSKAVGHPKALRTWRSFNRLVASRLSLTCPVHYEPFAGWRRKKYWLKRKTDVLTGAQPALKDKFQVLFNMTLLGNSFLARLQDSGHFDVRPFQRRGRTPVLEVYPGHAMSQLGVDGYKSSPRRAITAILAHLARVGIRFTVAPEIRRRCESYSSGPGRTDFDAADALVAAGIGALFREDLARDVIAPSSAKHRLEGAILSL
jgi:hypothetical protein